MYPGFDVELQFHTERHYSLILAVAMHAGKLLKGNNPHV
jgi:hypothetical protein